MSEENCLICATNEGVFIDVVEQPTLLNKANNCRLEKVSDDAHTTKVCHKCAFEIDQCHNFVEKVKLAASTTIPKRKCCILCFDPYDEDIFFDLSRLEFGVNEFTQRIRDLFPNDFQDKELQKQLICLSCRYCVDLLTDLRTLSEEVSTKLNTIIKNGINPADLPKTKTSIVSRNTTFIRSSNLHLNTPSDTDSDSSSIMVSKKKTKKNNNAAVLKAQQKCHKCKTTINGNNIYKIHKTKSIACNMCWLSIDHGKMPHKNKKRKKIDYPETKLCSILLEDILQSTSNNHKDFKIETDDEGNTLFKVENHSGYESQTEVEIHYPRPSLVGSQKKENLVQNNEEIKETKSFRGTNRRRKESEHCIQEAPEVKSPRNRERKESEQSIQEAPEVTSTKNKQCRESEESIQEVSEVKAAKSRQRRDSEQSIQEVSEKRSTRSRRRKESEQSSQEEPEVRSIRSSRRRKDSEQNVKDSANEKPVRTSRRRKDSEQSIQDINEEKAVLTTRRRKDSEKSTQEELEVKTARSTRNKKASVQDLQETTNLTEVRKRKDSEQSIQEDIEINVDVDSDSAPVSKKAKKSETKAEPKHISKSKVKNQSGSSIRKRGRSSSVESTASVRKSARNAKKNKAQELDEIIEIDNESDTDITQKENVSDNEDTLPNSKRSKRSDSISSKESSPVSQFKTPSNKNSPESYTPSAKDRSNETHDDEVATSKSPHVESSESEEIDILKSTDEETKGDDTFETITEDKDVFESGHNDDEKLDKDKEQVIKESDVTVETNLKALSDDTLAKDDSEKSNGEIPNTPLSSKNSTKSNIEESPKLIIEDKAKSEDQKSIENFNNENDAAVENTEEIEEQSSISRRSSVNSNSRKSNTLGRRKSKKGEKNSVNDIVVYDNSDSEEPKNVEKIIDSYACTICDKVFENKFTGLQHELTHMKTLEIKLPRIEAFKTDKSNNEVITNSESKVTVGSSPLKKVVDTNAEELEVENEEEAEKANENEDEKPNDDEIKDNREPDTKTISDENENADTEEVGKKDVKNADENEKVEENNKDHEQVVEKDTVSEKSVTEQNELIEEESDEDKVKQYSPRRSTRNTEDKSDRKSRGRRKTTNDVLESQEQTPSTVVSEDDKIAEAVKETLNDIAELQGKIQAASTENGTSQEIDQEKENADDNIMEIVESRETILNDNVETTEISQNENNEAMEVNERDNETTKSDDDIMECETIQDNEEETENNVETTGIVDVDAESSREVVDIEQEEAAKQAEESEVEITEVDDAQTETTEPTNEIVCEQVDLTENDDNEVPRPDDDIEIEEIIEPDKIHEDENTVDSVTEINVIAEEEPCMENDAGNIRIERNEKNNEDDDNNTEDEEALAQQSLEDLLQRKGLQVIDEFAESVTDGDEESEKEANVSSEKENCPQKDAEVENELEIKISDAECTEILGINNRSINKQKDVEVTIADENQIIQDVDVVEEVIQDSDVVQEVEVESNGNCLDVANDIEGQGITNAFNIRTVDTEKRSDLQTEPISDDETDFASESFGSITITKEIRNNQDMPSLDPIGEGIDDE